MYLRNFFSFLLRKITKRNLHSLYHDHWLCLALPSIGLVTISTTLLCNGRYPCCRNITMCILQEQLTNNIQSKKIMYILVRRKSINFGFDQRDGSVVLMAQHGTVVWFARVFKPRNSKSCVGSNSGPSVVSLGVFVFFIHVVRN